MTIQELEDRILAARKAYYNSEVTIMSDAEYDDLEDELRALDPTNEVLNEIGKDSEDGFPKAKHTILMGSQAKANTVEQVETWLKHFPSSKVEVLVQDKLDGISLELNYTNKNLASAITRGDGYKGDLVTENAKKMDGVPTATEAAFSGAVRGEILLLHSDKEKYFPDMKNCRNAASGIMKHLDGSGCERLTLICYDVQNLDPNDKFETETDKLEFLTANGFNRVQSDYMKLDLTTDQSRKEAAQMLLDKMTEYTTREKEFDTDGVVVKMLKVDNEDLRTELRPKSQIAIKPARIWHESVLRDIEWNMVNGTLTPVAVYDEVDMEGALCTRATLNNVRYIEDLKLEIGDKISLIRANMVIPRIMGNITKGTKIDY